MDVKWIIIGAIVLLLLLRPKATTPVGAVYQPTPLYGPTPGPNYATAPPTQAIGGPPVRPASNVYDVITAGIGAAGNLASNAIQYYETGDN